MTDAAASTGKPGWFGHPKGLTVLFLTEMWEKFSFYGMRALLVYYMTKQLLMGQQQASLVYGVYTALAYFTPILGGQIADRWLGKRRSVILGGSIMAVGHFMMAFEPLLYGALAAIVIGNGFFLPSLPSQVQELYSANDARKGTAYNVYYVGVNLGAILAPLVCGALGETLGWHYGFAAAGVGMIAGLVIYIAGGRHLPPDRPKSTSHHAAGPSAAKSGKAAVGLLLAIGLVVVLLRGAYEQMGNTIALWADKGVDRTVGDLVIPMTWFQSLNPLLVFVLTPLIVARWTRLARTRGEGSPLRKMSLGASAIGLAYLLIAAVAAMTAGPASWLWLALFFFIYTAGELYVLPVGLGVFGRLAPAQAGATTIAAWFLAAFAGNLLAGLLGVFWSRLEPAPFFALMAVIAVAAGAAFLVLDKAWGQRATAILQSGAND